MPTRIRSKYRVFAARREHRRRGGQAPGDHDAADPFSGANARQDHVAGDAAGDIGDVEQRRGQAELGPGETQIAHHGEAGEADVDPIQKREDKQQEQEPEQVP